MGKGLGLVTAAAITAVAMMGPMIGGAALAQDSEKAIGASLFGENEVGGEGADEDAGGDFSGFLDMKAGTLCYYLDHYGLDTVTAAHLHEGKKGENGPPVVTLDPSSDDEVCVEVEAELLARIAKDEERFYVNVHTEKHPAGAIRGQLGS